jgi:hypothetical protein
MLQESNVSLLYHAYWCVALNGSGFGQSLEALSAIDCVQVSCRCVLPTWEVAEYAAPAELLIFLVIYYP